VSHVAAAFPLKKPSRKTESFIALSPVLMVTPEKSNVAQVVTAVDQSQQPPCFRGTTVTPLTTFASISTRT
jgi:hypothetical protein